MRPEIMTLPMLFIILSLYNCSGWRSQSTEEHAAYNPASKQYQQEIKFSGTFGIVENATVNFPRKDYFVKNCLQNEDREKCFTWLISAGSPIALENGSQFWDSTILDDDQDIDELCKELGKTYKDQDIKHDTYKMAAYNFASCVCNYANDQMKKKNKNSEYESDYSRFHCSEGTRYLEKERNKWKKENYCERLKKKG
jgi:hypothetical protein